MKQARSSCTALSGAALPSPAAAACLQVTSPLMLPSPPGGQHGVTILFGFVCCQSRIPPCLPALQRAHCLPASSTALVALGPFHLTLFCSFHSQDVCYHWSRWRIKRGCCLSPVHPKSRMLWLSVPACLSTASVSMQRSCDPPFQSLESYLIWWLNILRVRCCLVPSLRPSWCITNPCSLLFPAQCWMCSEVPQFQQPSASRCHAVLGSSLFLSVSAQILCVAGSRYLNRDFPCSENPIPLKRHDVPCCSSWVPAVGS